MIAPRTRRSDLFRRIVADVPTPRAEDAAPAQPEAPLEARDSARTRPTWPYSLRPVLRKPSRDATHG